jgi:hypothetical protein
MALRYNVPAPITLALRPRPRWHEVATSGELSAIVVGADLCTNYNLCTELNKQQRIASLLVAYTFYLREGTEFESQFPHPLPYFLPFFFPTLPCYIVFLLKYHMLCYFTLNLGKKLRSYIMILIII